MSCSTEPWGYVYPQVCSNTTNYVACEIDAPWMEVAFACYRHGEPAPAARVRPMPMCPVQHSGMTGYQRHGPQRGAHENPVGERALRAAG